MRVASLGAALMAASFCAAQEITTDSVTAVGDDSLKLFHLGEVTVVGHPAHDLDAVDPARTMAIEPRGDVAHAVAELPGVTLREVGPRNESQVSLRGYSALQTGLYLDGVPLYVPYDGNVDLARFSTGEIGQISVTKGASPLSLGPNSLGGAIQLTTKEPTQPLEASAEAGMRTVRGEDASMSVGTRQTQGYLLAIGSVRNLDAWEMPGDWTPRPTENGWVRNNSYSRDGMLHLKGGWTPDDRSELAVSFIDQVGEKGDPPYAGINPTQPARYWQWPSYDRQSAQVVGRMELAPGWTVRAPVYLDHFSNLLWAYDDSTYTTQKKPFAFRSHYSDWTWGGNVQLEKGRAEDTIRAFAHFKQDLHTEVSTTNDTAKAVGTQAFVTQPQLEDEDRTVSLGLEAWRALPRGISVAPGFSWDTRQSIFADSLVASTTKQGATTVYNYGVGSFLKESPDAFNEQVAVRWDGGAPLQLKAGLSNRTRFPSIKERYSFKLGTAIPNENLQPEHSLQAELEATSRPLPWLVLQTSLWESWITDAIVSVPNVGGAGISQNQNVGYARFSGPEWFVQHGSDFALPAPELSFRATIPFHGVALDRLVVGGNWSYTIHRDISNPALPFQDLPVQQVRGYVLWAPVSWADLTWQTSAQDGAPSTQNSKTSQWYRTAGWTTSDVSGSVRWRDLELKAGVTNLFDEDYALTEGYPEEGRTGFVQMRWNLQ